MALNTGKILMRRGQEANFDPNKMIPGEWAVSLDSKYVRMCFSPGVCIRMATYEAFEADMETIRNILSRCETIEDAVTEIYDEIKGISIDVERIETASANALKSEQNALNSETNAKVSETVASDKAAEAILSAETAANKASEAANSSTIAIQKSNEASEYADTASESAIVSQSYAVGGTGTRDGEDTDNAKFYNEQSRSNAERAEDAADRAVAIAGVDIATVESAGLVKPDGDSIKILPDGTIYTNTSELEKKLEETTEKVDIIIQKAELNIKDSASGESIHLTDSADGKIVDFALFGRAIQKSTTGKNILSFTAPYPSIMGKGLDFITHEDNSVTVRGTATSQLDWYVVGSWAGQTNVLPISEGQIIVKGFTPTPRLDLYVNGYQSVLGNITPSGGDLKLTINSNNTVRGVFYRFVQGYTYDLTLYPMIRACDEFGDPIGDDTYEPYTGGNPSPNPDYPQNIEVPGSDGDVEVKSANEDGTKSITATIPTPNGIAGVKVNSDGNYTDENGQQWICDEIVKYADGTGKRVKRINKVIADGVNVAFAERYIYDINAVYSIHANTIPMMKEGVPDKLPPLMSSHFIHVDYVDMLTTDIIGITSLGGYSDIFCGFGQHSELSNLELANEWLTSNNVTIYYQLETPVETPLTAEEIAEIESLHTLYPVTNISNDADCGMKVTYIADSKNYIDNKLALQTKAREEEMMAMFLLLPEETQAKMIENDTNNLLTESEE